MRNRNRAASKKDYDITNLDTEIDSQAVRLAGEDRAMSKRQIILTIILVGIAVLVYGKV